MDITFKNKKLTRIFSSEKTLVREFGPQIAKIIKRRMAVLAAATCLDEVPHCPPERRHALTQDKRGQFAVDLKQPHRMVFKPNHKRLPRSKDGSLDLEGITAITILGVEDYH